MTESAACVYLSQHIPISTSRYHNDLDLAILHAVLNVPVRRGPRFYQNADGRIIQTDTETIERITDLLEQAKGLILVARGPLGLPLIKSGLPIKNLPGILVWATRDAELATKASRYLSKYQDWVAVSTQKKATIDVIERFSTEYLRFDEMNMALIPPDAFDIMAAPIPSSHEFHLTKARGLVSCGLLPIVSVPLARDEAHHHPTVILYFLIKALDRALREHAIIPGIGGHRMYSILFSYVDVIKTDEGVRLIFPAISRGFAKVVASHVRPFKYSYANMSPLEHHLSLSIPSLYHGGICVWEGDTRPDLNPSIILEGKNTEDPITLCEFDEMTLEERFKVIKCGPHLYSIDSLVGIVQEPRVLPLDRLPLNPHIIRSKLYMQGIITHHSKPGIVASEPPHLFPHRDRHYHINSEVSFPEETWSQLPHYLSGQVEEDVIEEEGVHYKDGIPIVPACSLHLLNFNGMNLSFVGEHDITRVKTYVHNSLCRGMGLPLWRYFYPHSNIPHYLAVSPAEDMGAASDYVIAALTSEFP